MKPRLLDLFCGAGGAAMGYARAGFEVVGVDIKPQPNYPFEFAQGDVFQDGLALFAEDYFDAVHASPPCPAYSLVSGFQGVAKDHPDLVGLTRGLLELDIALPYVIENVPGSPLRRDLVLCGEQFGLRIHRHRVFELGGWFAMQNGHGRHALRGAKTNCEKGEGVARWITGNYADHEDASDAMGIDWMTRRELKDAVPPAYTEFIGTQLMAHLNATVAA
jgi:DNA (cytosine-5)-methyltransferase 1